jgi:hypothetical protein
MGEKEVALIEFLLGVLSILLGFVVSWLDMYLATSQFSFLGVVLELVTIVLWLNGVALLYDGGRRWRRREEG